MLLESARWKLRKRREPRSFWPGCADSAGAFPRTSSSTAWKPMSGARPFFDTSVLLYLLSAEVAKADRVEELLERSGSISVQVLNEFTSVATRKLGLSFAEIREVLEVVRTLCVVH